MKILEHRNGPLRSVRQCLINVVIEKYYKIIFGTMTCLVERADGKEFSSLFEKLLLFVKFLVLFERRNLPKYIEHVCMNDSSRCQNQAILKLTVAFAKY